MTKKIVEWKAKRYGTKGMFGARCVVCLHALPDGGPRIARGLLRRDPSSDHVWRIHCVTHAEKAGCPERLLYPKVKSKTSEKGKTNG